MLGEETNGVSDVANVWAVDCFRGVCLMLSTGGALCVVDGPEVGDVDCLQGVSVCSNGRGDWIGDGPWVKDDPWVKDRIWVEDDLCDLPADGLRSSKEYEPGNRLAEMISVDRKRDSGSPEGRA